MPRGRNRPWHYSSPILVSELALLLQLLTTVEGVPCDRGHGVQNNILAGAKKGLPSLGSWKVLRKYSRRALSFKLLCCCSVTQSCLTLCDSVDCNTPDFPVLHHLPERAHTHVHWVGDATQPSVHLPSLSPPAFNLSQHQGLSQWVSSLHQVAKVLKFQLQHQSFQWLFRTDFL